MFDDQTEVFTTIEQSTAFDKWWSGRQSLTLFDLQNLRDFALFIGFDVPSLRQFIAANRQSLPPI